MSMRMLNRNKQQLYYALHIGVEPIYELDENGDKIIEYIDKEGNIYYRESGEYKQKYSEPVSFEGNIATSGGESEAIEFGLNMSDYEAVLIVDKGFIPVSETSLIWHDTEPVILDDGSVDGESADYSIVKLSPSLNSDKYVLKKLIK